MTQKSQSHENQEATQGYLEFHELPCLLRAAEVADLLRTTTRSIYAMTERGQLPGIVRVGRRLLFRRDDLLQLLRKSCPSPEDR